MQKVRQSLACPPWEQAAPGNLRWQQQRPKPILEQIETSRPLSPADAQTMVAGSVVKIYPFKVEARLRARRMAPTHILLDI